MVFQQNFAGGRFSNPDDIRPVTTQHKGLMSKADKLLLDGLVAVPHVRVRNSANLSIANNTLTSITYDTEDFDASGMHSTSSNTERLVAVRTGLHAITANIRWASSGATNRRDLRIFDDSGNVVAIAEHAPVAAATDIHQILTTFYRLPVGGYVYLQVFQDSGAALNVLANSPWSPSFSMYWVTA